MVIYKHITGIRWKIHRVVTDLILLIKWEEKQQTNTFFQTSPENTALSRENTIEKCLNLVNASKLHSTANSTTILRHFWWYCCQHLYFSYNLVSLGKMMQHKRHRTPFFSISSFWRTKTDLCIFWLIKFSDPSEHIYDTRSNL